MRKIIAASVLSLLILLNIGSANSDGMRIGVGTAYAEKISASANEVLLNGKVLNSSANVDNDIHVFTVNYKKRVWICKIYFSSNDYY